MLKEEDAWRMALVWQETLQERVRLIATCVETRVVKTYDWVALHLDGSADFDQQLELVHTFKAASTVWFALSCCRGYGGGENPGFWRRVFGKLRESRLPVSGRNAPTSSYQDEYRHLVTDAIRFFCQNEFPRVQLFADRFHDLDRQKELVLVQAFFRGSDKEPTAMQIIGESLHSILDELSPFVLLSRVQRVIPVSLRLTKSQLPMSTPELDHLLSSIPNFKGKMSIFDPAFVVQNIPNGQDLTVLESAMTLFQNHSIEMSYLELSMPFSYSRNFSPALYCKLMLGVDASIQVRVNHGFHMVMAAYDPHLEALCSGLPHTRSLHRLTLSGGDPISADDKWAWIGYALFHPRGASSSWSSLELLDHEVTIDNIQKLEAMVKGNNLRAIQSGLPSQNTVYHSGQLRAGSVVHFESAGVVIETTEEMLVDAVFTSDDAVSSLPRWMCVILPAHGLGWTLSNNIHQLTAHSPTAVHLKSLKLDSNATRLEPLIRLLSTVGADLECLDIGDMLPLDADAVARLFQVCPKLISLRVCHDGSFWTAETTSRSSEHPPLQELVLRLPPVPRNAAAAEIPKFQTLREAQAYRPNAFKRTPISSFISPSLSAARISLYQLEALRLEANEPAVFDQNRDAIQEAIHSLSSLKYFHFQTTSSPGTKRTEPMSHAAGQAQSWSRIGVTGNQSMACRKRLFSLLCVCQRSQPDSAIHHLDRDVIEVIMAFATSRLEDLWVDNNGNQVQWKFRN